MIGGRGRTGSAIGTAAKKSFGLEASVANILVNPRSEWISYAHNGVRTAAKDIDWQKFNKDDYLLTQCTIVCSVETEDDGHTIIPACNNLVNANGNAWTNDILLATFRSFVGAQNYLEHCFPSGTQILMADGTYKNIEDVASGDEIINAKGEKDIVEAVVAREYNGKLVCLSSHKILNKTLKVTPEHPILVYVDRGVCPKTNRPIRSVLKSKKGSHILYDDIGFAYGVHPGKDDVLGSRWGSPKFVNAADLNDERMLVTFPICHKVEEYEKSEMNKNRAYLLGWYLAEGYLCQEDKHVVFCLSAKERGFAEEIAKLLEIEFPSINKTNHKGDKICGIIRESEYKGKPSSINVDYYCPEAALFFKKWGGKFSWAKELSASFLFMPLDIQKEMIKGLFLGDGTDKVKHRGALLNLRSKNLIQQTKFILSRFGYDATYRVVMPLKRYSVRHMQDGYEVYEDPNTHKKSRPGYQLNISRYDWAAFCEKPCESKNSTSSKVFEDSYIVYAFDKSEEEFSGLVYNLHVKNDNTYIAEGIAVHNCQIPALSKGTILDAVIRPVEHTGENGEKAHIYYVDILVATSREHTDLVEKIESGRLTTLSMGATCEYVTCSKCGGVFTDDDSCEHIKNEIGQKYFDEQGKERIVSELCGRMVEKDGKLVADPDSVTFIEASWVEHPAFKGAVLEQYIEGVPASTKSKHASYMELTDAMEDIFKLRVADEKSGLILKVAQDEARRIEREIRIARVTNEISR